MSHFKGRRKGIKATFSPQEKMFLSDVLPLLADVGNTSDDPAARRLQVPVYLDDPEANEEWWRLMGQDLDEARSADRSVFRTVMTTDGPADLSVEEADAFLRVLNESRLVLAARAGLEVESDHDELPADSRQVLDYLGWILEELTTELYRFL
ncbi:MAG: DUF2017 family protein [Actinomycetota bacterium]|nr:DUF2017 family protein [Actinomycetota bacterium]